jgi:hypothetical protein
MTQFVPVEKKPKPVYQQDWKAYTKSQTNELPLFMKLLADLCTNVEQPEYEFGRPALPYSDMVFASATKVYSTMSLRRFMSHMQQARSAGYVSTSCTYVSVSNFMRKSELTPILKELIKITSLPLAAIETTLGVDSSGFSTSRFERYYNFKYGKDKLQKGWIKAHVCSGVKTNIVTAVELTEVNKGDSPYFIPLIEKSAQVFELKEAVADKAYSSRENLEFVKKLGGEAVVPFRSNSTGRSKGSRAWKKMYHYFMFNREEFMKRYHQRSNCETVFHMIKSKFRDNVRSKDKTAQFNEVLLKILCHNICVVIQEIHELGIEADFTKKADT